MRVPKSDSDLAEKVVGLALTATAALVLNYGPEIKDKLKDDVMPAAKAKWNAWFKNKEDDSAAIEAGAEETAADAVPSDLTDGSGKALTWVRNAATQRAASATWGGSGARATTDARLAGTKAPK
jgi:hypothetical protein